MCVFTDRIEAGKALSTKLAAYKNRKDVIILALPRGGVPLAYEVAVALQLPLELFIVRKLGIPFHEEFAMGALAADGSITLNNEIINKFGISEKAIQEVINKEKLELNRRNELYRKGRDFPSVTGKIIILIDDGIATGSTMSAAISALKTHNPAKIILAVPVCSKSSFSDLGLEVDDVICLSTPSPFYAVGQAYLNFSQVSDEEVHNLLCQAERKGLCKMTKTNENNLLTYITQLYGNTADYDSLLEMSQNAEHVFIGESTHGTNEFYQIRADLTKRLILEGKFNAIAIEGDWPDTYRINRYVKGDKTITNAIDALNEFKRFPTWMWRNKVVVEFIEWLRQHNASLTLKDRIGFYGLDLYSLNASVKAVVQYLEKEDAQAAARAKKRYACFDNFKDQLQNYGYVTMFDMSKSCENVVIEQLLELNQNAYRYIKENSTTADDFFYIEQNARLIKNAEKYYRSIFGSNSYSWNMRDCHMAETLDNLAQHLTKKLQSPAKIVTWAHNSHLGDARATEVSKQGQLNIGQLAREKYGNKVILIGFLTYAGYVTAASSWDGIAERKHIRHALPGSYEYFFHNLSSSNFLINLRDNEQMKNLIPNKQLERAIGVIYSPATERISHYFHANLSSQFDAVIYIDKTTAIHPLETTATWHKGEIFETYPSGL